MALHEERRASDRSRAALGGGPERLARTGAHIIGMAETEGLTAHANAIKVRMDELA